ncbi:MAG: response regulator [Polyangiaceae bacterium]|nr:response regulator [Polyangiaceae bacterium]
MMGSGAKRDAAEGRPGRWIVVADDDDDMRSLLSGLFRADGFVVSEAKDGQELLAMLVARTAPDGTPIAPDLVVTDVQMPGATGIRVLSHVRRAHPTVPVILITAFGSVELHAQAKRLGAATVLDKPFDIGELRKLVQRLLSTN